MSAVVDTSILIDALRGEPAAEDLLLRLGASEPLFASEVTRFEVIAGMRDREEIATRRLLSAFTWCPVDTAIAEHAGQLARVHGPANRGIDAADYLIAATAREVARPLVTTNVKHFRDLIPGITSAY